MLGLLCVLLGWGAVWLLEYLADAASHFSPLAAGAAVALALGLLVPVLDARFESQGLPGWESPHGLPPTDIYRWVQELEQPTRIYAAGLRPYGLYGRRWQNSVFYDLHSVLLEIQHGGPGRLAGVLRHFEPDLIITSIDPDSSTGPPRKPLLDWLRDQDCLAEVYADPVASAFRVEGGCSDIVTQHSTVGSPPPRMGS